MIYIVTVHRAFASPSVSFGPFDTIEEARAWTHANLRTTTSIIAVHAPDTDTGPFAEVWQ